LACKIARIGFRLSKDFKVSEWWPAQHWTPPRLVPAPLGDPGGSIGTISTADPDGAGTKMAVDTRR
jgi:hypothetical protein